MNAESIIGLVIVSIVAVIMIGIGLFQYLKKDKPVGFYTVNNPPKKEEISDITKWNRQHGLIWIIYGICVELGFSIGFMMPSEILAVLFLLGGIIIPMPFMVIRHNQLERKYKV